MLRIGLVQLNASDDPTENLNVSTDLIAKAAAAGATHIFTPEVTNLVCTDRRRQQDILQLEKDDETLHALRVLARDLGIWLQIGSLALKSAHSDKFVNRAFLISPDGGIAARYNKIHLFDVSISERETYRESSAYEAGDAAVVADMGEAMLGMSICYDLRFPHLYRDLALAGANLIAVPGAFSMATGPSQIETLLKARAIETGAFVVMAAQTGAHKQTVGRPRETWGHSIVLSPWGEKLCDMGRETGFQCLEIDLTQVEDARTKIPSLFTNPEYSKP